MIDMKTMNKKDKRKRLGEQLVEKGLATFDQVEIALTEQKKSGRLIGEILVSMGFISESVMRDVLSQVLGLGSIELQKVVPDAAALKLVPKDIAERYVVVPVSFLTSTSLCVLSSSPKSNNSE